MSEAPKMCQWFQCTAPATVRIVRGDTLVCDEHHRANMLQFGCVFTIEPVNQKTQSVESSTPTNKVELHA